MREILFRGKSLKTRKWTQGYLFRCWERAYIAWGMVNDNADMIEVDPETVCQYTGHKDDTGKRIFEGDIVNFTDGTSTESGFWETCCCGKVGYDEEEACFYVTDRLFAESWEVLGECHIIGNIFDNADLLRG